MCWKIKHHLLQLQKRGFLTIDRTKDGDYIIIDKADQDVKTGDVVLAIVDNKATVKKLIDDRENGQIVLMAESSFDYEPIYLHSAGPDGDGGCLLPVIVPICVRGLERAI